MEEQTQPPDPLRRLHAVLDRLVRRLSRRVRATPREMQMDASAAIGLLREVELPSREYLASRLAHLIRELGQKRPNVFQYVVMLEETVGALEDRIRRSSPPPAG